MIKSTPLPPLPSLLARRPYAGKAGHIEITPPDELLDLIADPANVLAAIDLWDAKSGYRGVLTNGSAQMSADGTYRYKLGASPIAQSVRTGVIRMSNSVRTDIRATTTSMVNGEISQNDWYECMKKIILILLLAAWLAGIGGIFHYYPSDVNVFSRIFDPQNRWLDNFADQLNAKSIKMDGRIISRATSYGRASYVAFQAAQMEAARGVGLRQARRVLGENENHCVTEDEVEGCIELAQMGFMDIDLITPIGQSPCDGNCLCHYEFRRSPA